MGDTPASIIRDMALQEANAHGVDVLAVELKGQGARQLVRVVVDRKGGVSIDTCQKISRALSVRLDGTDPIDAHYTLEVTSPGTDWPLTGQPDFDRIEGREVLIHHRDASDRVEQVRGRVVAAGPTAVEVDDGRMSVAVAYSDILKAAQVLPW
jgi:ribosome maturation factor RimP